MKDPVRVSEVQTADWLQMSCKHRSLEVRPKACEAVSSAPLIRAILDYERVINFIYVYVCMYK